MDFLIFDKGLSFAISVLVVIAVVNIGYKIGNAVVEFIRQGAMNSKQIADKNVKYIEELIDENKKNTDDFKEELAKSNHINLELADSNKKAQNSIDMAIRTIELLSNTHANMLADVNIEVKELRETQLKNHDELLNLINKKSGGM